MLLLIFFATTWSVTHFHNADNQDTPRVAEHYTTKFNQLFPSFSPVLFFSVANFKGSKSGHSRQTWVALQSASIKCFILLSMHVPMQQYIANHFRRALLHRKLHRMYVALKLFISLLSSLGPWFSFIYRWLVPYFCLHSGLFVLVNGRWNLQFTYKHLDNIFSEAKVLQVTESADAEQRIY